VAPRPRRVAPTLPAKPGTYLLAILLFTACYLPFLAKPFHIDDPLFLWSARQIQAHPLDFYGFSVNWYGDSNPMSEVMQNPPLTSYYLALAALLAGWSEVALHLAMLLPALGVLLGTYRLARALDADASMAALVTAFSPALFVSATTVMSDVLALCLAVWAVELWVRGLRERRNALLAASAVFASLGALAKYIDVAMVPLLLVYGVASRKRLGAWALWLLVPVAAILGYEAVTRALYGHGLLAAASAYAGGAHHDSPTGVLARLAAGLAFTGGAFAPFAFFAHRLRPPVRLWTALGILAAGLAVPLLVFTFGNFSPQATGWGVGVQLFGLSLLGAAVLALGPTELWRERSPESLLLVLWVVGIFLFATVVNWTLNVRSILPMAPAAAILLARRLPRPEQSGASARQLWPILPAAALSMLVAWADLRAASTARDEAIAAAAAGRAAGAKVWFEGHWGFQYYCEQRGLSAVDFLHSEAKPGELLVLPETNTNVFGPPTKLLRRLELRSFEQDLPLTTMSLRRGAGFYSTAFGPLPFSFGSVPPERLQIFQILQQLGPRQPPAGPPKPPTAG
jgi:4-amino-4-deoxy-L-arabinose transferase-like glycosyltransferase